MCDGEHFDGDYVAALRDAGARVLQTVDGARFDEYVSDVLLDQNPDAEKVGYRCASWTKQLFGTRYALVRPEFVRLRSRPRATHTGHRALVIMGGSDPARQTVNVVNGLSQLRDPDLQVSVVLGSRAPDADRVEEAVRANGASFQVHRDPADVATLMAAADLAISAAGSTCWELCCLGIPSILVAVAGDQIRVAAALARAGASESLGWHSRVTAARIGEAARSLLADVDRRESMGRAARALVDGRGAGRVTAVMAEGIRL